MKKIIPPLETPTGPRRELFLIPDTLRLPDGREFRTQDLYDRSRREYHSINLQKKINPERKTYQRYPPEKTRWIAEQDIDTLQFRLRLTRPQALLLKYRSVAKLQQGKV